MKNSSCNKRGAFTGGNARHNRNWEEAVRKELLLDETDWPEGTKARRDWSNHRSSVFQADKGYGREARRCRDREGPREGRSHLRVKKKSFFSPSSGPVGRERICRLCRWKEPVSSNRTSVQGKNNASPKCAIMTS